MAVKTIATPFNLHMSLVSKVAYIVDNKIDAENLSEKGAGVMLITLDNGESIGTWTPTKGFGDWDADNIPTLKFIKFYVTLSPSTRVGKNTDKFLKELKTQLAARGAGLEVLTVPNGSTVSDLLFKYSVPSEYFIEAMKPKADAADGDAGHEGGDDDSSEADKLFKIAEDGFDFHYSVEDGGFLTRKIGPKYAYVVSGGTPSLRNFIINEYRTKNGNKIPTRSSVSDALSAIEAACELSESRTRKLNIRSARSASTGNVWVDLGRMDGQVIGITAGRWGIAAKPDADVFFKRTDEVKELPIPHVVDPADVKTTLTKLLRPAFNITNEEFPLVTAWMISQIMPHYRAPVAMFLGESGSGKTTATSTLSALLEGVVDHGAVMPDGKDNLAVTISQEKISIWNNVSRITPSSSDDICQYIDGASYKKRRLHSDSGVVNLTLNPSILLNGISFDGDLRADLKTRSLIFNMGLMNVPSGSIDEIVKTATDGHAVILGAVYTLAAQVLEAMPTTVIPHGASRMVDYTKTLIIIDKLWELEGVGYATYMRSTSEMSIDSLEDPVFKILHSMTVNGAYVKEDGTYSRTFTNDELYTAFNDFGIHNSGRVARQLLDMELKDTRTITAYLKRNVTDWKKFGFSYVDHGSQMINGVRASRKTFTFDPKESNSMWIDHNEAAALAKF